MFEADNVFVLTIVSILLPLACSVTEDTLIHLTTTNRTML